MITNQKKERIIKIVTINMKAIDDIIYTKTLFLASFPLFLNEIDIDVSTAESLSCKQLLRMIKAKLFPLRKV